MDECTVQNDPSTPNDWLLRLPSQIYDEDKVNLQAQVKPEWSQMVWGSIWIGSWSDLMIMCRDEAAPHKGYSSMSYIQTLEEGLIPCYLPRTFFLQDNAKIHTSRATMTWFRNYNIRLQPHPPHSPDLNPIEHIWKAMKAILRKRYPHLWILRKNEANRLIFEDALKAAWWAVPQSLIDKLIRSMPRRLRAVRKARGYYTKY